MGANDQRLRRKKPVKLHRQHFAVRGVGEIHTDSGADNNYEPFHRLHRGGFDGFIEDSRDEDLHNVYHPRPTKHTAFSPFNSIASAFQRGSHAGGTTVHLFMWWAVVIVVSILLGLFYSSLTKIQSQQQQQQQQQQADTKKTDDWNQDDFEKDHVMQNAGYSHSFYYNGHMMMRANQEHRHRKNAASIAAQPSHRRLPCQFKSTNTTNTERDVHIGTGLEGFGKDYSSPTYHYTTNDDTHSNTKPVALAYPTQNNNNNAMRNRQQQNIDPPSDLTFATVSSTSSKLSLSPGHEDFSSASPIVPKANNKRTRRTPKQSSPDQYIQQQRRRQQYLKLPAYPDLYQELYNLEDEMEMGNVYQEEEVQPEVTPASITSLKKDDDSVSSIESSITFSELKLMNVIGGGGYGQVWKATWKGTPVAVKVLLGDAKSVEKETEFASEINMLKGMRHPNICLYMGACVDPPNRAIITELASNGSLWDALRQPLPPLFKAMDGIHGWPNILYEDDYQDDTFGVVPPQGTWPWAAVWRVASGAARGMTYLHGMDPPVLHRDLKSANLLLDDSFATKVCDFGLSRLKAHGSMTGNCGTVQWMAPEVSWCQCICICVFLTEKCA